MGREGEGKRRGCHESRESTGYLTVLYPVRSMPLVAFHRAIGWDTGALGQNNRFHLEHHSYMGS